MNKKLKFFLIFMIILLNASNFFSNIILIFNNGYLIEYFFLALYGIWILVVVVGLVKEKKWAYLITGVWYLVSAIFVLYTILFTLLGGRIWIFVGQFILSVILSIGSFYLVKRKKRSKQNKKKQQFSDNSGMISLKQYVIRSRIQGYSDEQIKEVIRKQGWCEKNIEEVFRS